MRASDQGAPFPVRICFYDADVNHCVCFIDFPLTLQVVLWKPVTAEFITKEKEVHLFVNASDMTDVKARLQDGRIQFRWASFAIY